MKHEIENAIRVMRDASLYHGKMVALVSETRTPALNVRAWEYYAMEGKLEGACQGLEKALTKENPLAKAYENLQITAKLDEATITQLKNLNQRLAAEHRTLIQACLEKGFSVEVSGNGSGRIEVAITGQEAKERAERQARQWMSVAATLNEVASGWAGDRSKPIGERATDAIRKLAKGSPDDAERSRAWFEVYETLKEVAPQLTSGPGRGIDVVLGAIKTLAENQATESTRKTSDAWRELVPVLNKVSPHWGARVGSYTLGQAAGLSIRELATGSKSLQGRAKAWDMVHAAILPTLGKQMSLSKAETTAGAAVEAITNLVVKVGTMQVQADSWVQVAGALNRIDLEWCKSGEIPRDAATRKIADLQSSLDTAKTGWKAALKIVEEYEKKDLESKKEAHENLLANHQKRVVDLLSSDIAEGGPVAMAFATVGLGTFGGKVFGEAGPEAIMPPKRVIPTPGLDSNVVNDASLAAMNVLAPMHADTFLKLKPAVYEAIKAYIAYRNK